MAGSIVLIIGLPLLLLVAIGFIVQYRRRKEFRLAKELSRINNEMKKPLPIKY